MCSHITPSPFYTLLQRRLHWAVILLISFQFLLQDAMNDALYAIEQQESLGLGQFVVTTLHTWGGAGIAVLMLWRWRLRKRAVPLDGGLMAHRKAFWVNLHHVSLYIVVLLMAATGALHYYLAWSLAGRWHELGKWLLLALLTIHVIGALSHMGSDSKVLQRMMGRGSLR